MSRRDRKDFDEKQAAFDSELRTERAKEDTLAALKRAQRESNATIETGNETTKKLGEQTDTINRIDSTLDKTEYELKVSDRLLKGMSGIGGTISSWFTRAPKAPPQQMPKSATPPPQKDAKKKGTTTGGKGGRGGDAIQVDDFLPQKGGGKEATKGGSPKEDRDKEFERKVDTGLDALARDLMEIKGQAKLHSEVLGEQNKRLDAIAQKTDDVDAHMKKNQRKIKRML